MAKGNLMSMGFGKTRHTVLFTIAFTCLIGSLYAQINPEPYLFSSQIENDVKLNQIPIRKAVEFSFIGAYEKALASYELDQSVRENSGEKESTLSTEEKIRFKFFQAVEAVAGITKLAKDKKIIILNEAHHKQLHRVFAEALLESLYDLGFRYLGLESLTPNFDDPLALGYDTLLNKRGYALNSTITGKYTREPQFAYLVRRAIAKGFHVFGYEATPFQKEEREVNEARNVLKIIEKDPDARIFLLCGFAHLVEYVSEVSEDPFKNYGKSKWMAAYIKEFSGIDPLTINQEVLTERVLLPNSPYYSLVDSPYSSILTDLTGKVFNGEEGLNKFDVLVYHPPTKYVFNRPKWLYRAGKFKPFFIKPDANMLCPCLVKVWYKGEKPLAVPVDVIEIGETIQQGTLVLLPGLYDVEIENEKGEKQVFEIRVE